MKKLDLYIIKKFLTTFFFSIVLILSIAVVFDYAEKIDDFRGHNAPFSAIIFDYYLNFIPYYGNLFSFLFIFISVVFFTSKMASDSEIVAILSSGISFRRLMLPYFISAAILAALSFLFSAYIIPQANKKRLAFEEQYYKNTSRRSYHNLHKQISPGQFIYMESYDANRHIGYRFSLEQFDNKRLTYKLVSGYINWDSLKNKWTIHNYYARHLTDSTERLESGKLLDTTLNMKPADFKVFRKMTETMTLSELDDYIAEQRLQGVSQIEVSLVEKYKRYAAPFSAFILTLIGVSLASRKVRGGTGAQMGFGLLISFSYILFQQVSAQFAISGNWNLLVAVWLPNFIFIIVAIILYRLAPK